MKDYYEEYLATLSKLSECRQALAWIEGFTRTALEYKVQYWSSQMTDIHAKADAALKEDADD